MRKGIEKKAGMSKVITNWLNEFGSKSTYLSYKSHINNYFNFLEKDPDTYLKDVRLMENGDRIKAMDDYEADITSFHHHLDKSGKAPRTVIQTLNCIKIFFRDNRIEFDYAFWKKRYDRGQGGAILTEDKAPTQEQLRMILQHASTKEKAIFLAMSSSGMRGGEATKVKLNDIKLELIPAEIHIKATMAKNKHPRKAYISQEAVDAIKEWLKIRNEYLIVASRKCNIVRKLDNGETIRITKSANDNRLFPYSSNTVRVMWERLVTKAGMDERCDETRRLLLHPHSLRKYFITQFSKHNKDMAELLAGHKGYLGGAYERTPEEDRRKAYLEGVNHLLVFSASESKEVASLKEQLKIRDGKVLEMENSVNRMQNQVDILNKEVERILEGASDLLEEKLERKEFQEEA